MADLNYHVVLIYLYLFINTPSDWGFLVISKKKKKNAKFKPKTLKIIENISSKSVLKVAVSEPFFKKARKRLTPMHPRNFNQQELNL